MQRVGSEIWWPGTVKHGGDPVRLEEVQRDADLSSMLCLIARLRTDVPFDTIISC
jgi:hypothetical protein